MIFKRTVLLQVLLLQVLVSGCAYINAQRDDLDSFITKWLTEQEFDKIKNTLTKVKTTHPQYLKLMLRKKEIQNKQNKFVTTTIKQARFFINENKWADAYTVYHFALNRVSDDRNLDFSYKYYLERRQIYISLLKRKILINNAERLIKDIPLQRKIAQAIKETFDEQNEFIKLQRQSVEIIKNLAECATDSIELKKIKMAKKCIQLAITLGPPKELLSKLKLSERKITQLTAGKNQKKQQAESNSHTRTLKEYKAAFEKNDLITANKKLTLLLTENKDDYELIKFKSILDVSINKKIKAGIETGRVLYSKGNIKLALNKWLKLKKLDPKNIELNSHISRAERVLRKLKTLKKNKNGKTNGN